MAVVEPFPSAMSGLGPSKDCVESTLRPAVFIQRSRAYTQQEHEHFLRSVHDSIYSRNVRGDRLYKYATTETHRGGWFSAFSRQDIETGRCPRLLRPGDQGWQLPRPIGRPFSAVAEVKRARMRAHTMAVPPTIYVPTPGGPPPKKIRRLEVQTLSLRPPPRVIEILDTPPLDTPPPEGASSSKRAPYVYEDYFALPPPTAGTIAGASDTRPAAAFMAKLTALLVGHA